MSGSAQTINYLNDVLEAYENAREIEKTTQFEAHPINNIRAKNHHAKIARANAMRNRERSAAVAKPNSAVKKVQGISILAVAGTLIIAVLMVIVVLAQVYYNDAVRETVRLNNHLAELSEGHRSLELAFVNAIDIREVERFARDELGMSRPDATQIIFLNSTVRDSAVTVEHTEQRNVESFMAFLMSLIDYFR